MSTMLFEITAPGVVQYYSTMLYLPCPIPTSRRTTQLSDPRVGGGVKMGKLKKKSKKAKRSKAVVDEKIARESKNTDEKLLEKLLEQADSCINKFEYGLAQKFLERALQHQPGNVTALESLAGVLLELGKPEEANSILLKAMEVSLDTRHSIYFSLAQLNEGKKALRYYKKGINIIERLLQNGTAELDKDEEKILRRDLSSGYCAMAEIYMTDCCFEEDAEEQCKSYIDKSIESDSSNPEAYQSFASFMLVKENREEAKKAMEESLSLWLPQYKAVTEGNTDCDIAHPLQVCPLDFDSRISTSKILIELEMFEEASNVLDGLVDEDDEVAEVWYLMGWMNYLRGEDYWGNAHYYFRKMIKVEAKTKAADPDQLSHANELLAELGKGDDSDGQQENGEVEISESEPEDMEI